MERPFPPKRQAHCRRARHLSLPLPLRCPLHVHAVRGARRTKPITTWQAGISKAGRTNTSLSNLAARVEAVVRRAPRPTPAARMRRAQAAGRKAAHAPAGAVPQEKTRARATRHRETPVFQAVPKGRRRAAAPPHRTGARQGAGWAEHATAESARTCITAGTEAQQALNRAGRTVTGRTERTSAADKRANAAVTPETGAAAGQWPAAAVPPRPVAGLMEPACGVLHAGRGARC